MFNFVEDGEDNIINGLSNTLNGVAVIAIGLSQTIYGFIKISKPYVVLTTERAKTVAHSVIPVIEENLKTLIRHINNDQLLEYQSSSSIDDEFEYISYNNVETAIDSD